MKIQTVEDIKQLGTILGVWAHPDDESFSCAGIMAAAVENGQTVACITATKGEAGVQDPSRWPPEQLGEIRAKEMAAALQEIGIKNQHWLDYPDGGCQTADAEEAVARIVALINHYQPQTILTFGPDGMTGHPDHQTVSKWSQLAVAKFGPGIAVYHVVQSREMYEHHLKAADEKFNIFFNIDEPPLREESCCDICLRLSPSLMAKKFRALAAMTSQTEAMLRDTPEAELVECFGIECFEEATLESV